MGPTRDEIVDARRRIEKYIYRTPLEYSHTFGVFLKLECWQRTRSFKVRGALNAVLSMKQPGELVTASAGNHGQGVALAAHIRGLDATIFLPSNAPETKKARIRQFGARLDERAAHYDEAEVFACEYAERTGAVFIHGFSDRDVVAGQGTVALEIMEDRPETKTIVVPVGGGGLISGVGIATKPDVRIIGVQSEKTAAMYDAFKAGHVVDSPIVPTLADGLAGATDDISYNRATQVVDELILVSESAISSAMKKAAEDGLIVEGSGAVGLAGLLEGKISPDPNTTVIVSGGNVDAKKLASIILSE